MLYPPQAGSVVVVAVCALLVSGCRGGIDPPSSLPRRERPPLRAPKKTPLEEEKEAAVMDWMDDLRGDDYLKRVKAEEELDRLMKEDPAGVAPYLVQLLDEPQLDIRVAVIRLFVKYGRASPDAVEMLIEVVNDAGMSVALRADASRALRGWTGEDFGYRAWTDPEGVGEAGGKWRAWFGRTGGYIPAPPAPPPEPEPEPEPEAKPATEPETGPQTESGEGAGVGRARLLPSRAVCRPRSRLALYDRLRRTDGSGDSVSRCKVGPAAKQPDRS